LRFKKFFLDKEIEIKIEFNIQTKKIFCKINQISNPKDAKKFTGKFVYIDRLELPKLDNRKFYYNDLIKINVYVNKQKFGIVNNVKNHGAGDYLEILNGKKEILVPMNNDHIKKINLEKGIIILNPVYYEI
tara:strand:- start:879 stop:1271 length:393 start_codon:yes stop_codon:yes gene_type:complete